MIVEGLVTTVDSEGSPHLAPMGPRVDLDYTRLTLRPFPTSSTYRNLIRTGVGIFHVTDDAGLIARAAVGKVSPFPPVMSAVQITGHVLAETCRWYEFEVASVDESQERITIETRIVHRGQGREFFGFNRARHALVEAAILATRLHLIPIEEITREYEKFRIIVTKTGGPAEAEAMSFLEAYVQQAATGSQP